MTLDDAVYDVLKWIFGTIGAAAMGVTAWLFKGKYDEIKEKNAEYNARLQAMEKTNEETKLRLQRLDDKGEHMDEKLSIVEKKLDGVIASQNKMNITLVRISERLHAGDSSDGNSAIKERDK